MNQNQSTHSLAAYGEAPADYSYDCLPQANSTGDTSFSKKPESDGDDDDLDDGDKDSKRAGRRKIKIEYIQDKSRRHITFSKRKAGIMKKAYELSTLTGTQVLLLVVSETGLVYTFTTPKLQPLVTKTEGKNLIQSCLNTPDETKEDSVAPEETRGDNSSSNGRESSLQNGNRETESKKKPDQNGTSQIKRPPTDPSPGLPPSYTGNVSSGYGSNNAPPFPQGMAGGYAPPNSSGIPSSNQTYPAHLQNPFMGQPSTHHAPMLHPGQHPHPSQPPSHHQNQPGPPHPMHHVPGHPPQHGHQSASQQQPPHHASAMPPPGYHDYHNGNPHYGQPQGPSPGSYPGHNPNNYYNHPGAPNHQ